MFKWIKIISRLSSEDGLIEKLDLRIQHLQENIVDLEKKKTESQELLSKYEEDLKKTQTAAENLIKQFDDFSETASKKISEIKECGEKYSRDGKAELEAISREMTEKLSAGQKSGEETLKKMESAVNDCSRLAMEKLLAIKEEAEKYTAMLADQISSYENNFDGFNKKLADLKDAILNLQR